MTSQNIIYRLVLDTHKNGVQRILQGFQTGEAVARRIEISLVAGTESVALPMGNISAVMYVKRPSQTSPSVNACTIDYANNKIIYELTASDESESGIVNMQLKLIDTTSGSTSVIVSPKFGFEVWESEVSDSTAETTSQYTALTLAIAQAEAVAHSAITEFVIDDDNLIVVTFADGSEYTSTVIQDALSTISDIEDYVERAETAMTSAEGSATSATASATTATASATTAVNAANSALLSATNASTSETNASTSETNAFTYASNASASATSASTSATNASTSESNASASASSASASATSASGSASSASTSATNAATSASNASASASSASVDATLSKSYAVGGTNSRSGEDNDNSKYYKEQCEQIASALQGGFIPMGTVMFANLPTNASAGWMYNVSDEFTSDNRFKDGGNKKYASGTNVYLTSDGKWDCLSGAVPTVNGKNGNSITLDGSDIAVTGYSKASSKASILTTDSVNTALGKLEKKADEVANDIASAVSNLGEVLSYKGTVATYADLPSNAQPGWVYHVTSEGTNYAYEVEPGASIGSWSEMGQHVDLSGYATKTEVNAKYTKPSGGIPGTDLSSAVQTSLGNGDKAVAYTDYTIGTTWVANTTIGDYETYPYKQTISTASYTTNRDCYVLGATPSSMPTKEECDEFGKLCQFVDFSNGVTVLASEETTVALTLRVRGV